MATKTKELISMVESLPVDGLSVFGDKPCKCHYDKYSRKTYKVIHNLPL